MKSLLPTLVWLGVLCAVGAAQGGEIRRVALRVTSATPGGAVVVDRGARDKLQQRDVVVLLPRTGGMYRGTVVRVDDRSAVVEMDERQFVPEPGTRGEALVPVSRFAPAKKPPVAPQQPAVPEKPTWKNKDEEYREGMPLLAEVRPVRPRERATTARGRAYVLSDLSYVPEDGSANSFLRTGIDMDVTNPFGLGGELHVDTELAALTEQSDNTGVDLLPRRLSYSGGGTRFAADRWEIGRFLQAGMPEFGVLDGVEWGRRRANGDRFGASLGFMPEPDDDFDSFADLQAAAYYLWSLDPEDRLTFGGGFQKTLHHGKTDRDLLIVKTRYLPESGWDFNAVAWIDFYYGRDDAKGSGAELTQGHVAATRHWDTGSGVSMTLSRTRFPEILRNGEFLPLLANEIAENRHDRLAFDWWSVTQGDSRWHGHLSGWNDEDDSGAAADLGYAWPDFLSSSSTTDITVFGTAAAFTSDVGARFSIGTNVDNGRWDVLYEIALRHNQGFPDDRDDILQHRLRISRSFYHASGWDLSVHAEGFVWDDEVAGLFGFHLQRSF